jgi:tetratricopeptide (TPR) repeat protein
VKLIAKDPDGVAAKLDRSTFRTATFDRKGALADLDDVIDRQPSADAYMRRARLRVAAGDLAAALVDANAATELEPGYDTASLKAEILTYLGKFDDAIGLLEEQGRNPDDLQEVTLQLGDLDALAGRKEDGLARIEAALEQRPGDPDLLNAKCYYRGTWNFHLEGLAEDCTEALQRARWAPYVLDSRAMSYFRLGRYEDAVKDLDAALGSNPDQTPSLFLRGVVREQMGDQGGKDDIRQALARDPSLTYLYGKYGIKPE